MTPDNAVALAAELADAFAPGADERDRSGDLPAANLALARDRGAPALTVPVEHGGMGADLHAFAAYQERLARGDGATALVLAMHHMLIGGEADAGLWPADSFAEVCGAAVERGALVNSAATEPGAGSPSLGGLPRATAAPRDGEAATAPAPGSAWLLSGRKAYTTGAPELAFMRVSATITPAAGEPFGARFLVRMPADGVSFDPDAWDPAALRAAANFDVIFDATPGVFLYREDTRGCEGNVWFQVAIAATYLGIGQAAYEAGRDHLRDRPAGGGGRTIADIESVRVRLGRVRGDLMVARRNLLATCAEWTTLPRARREDLVGAVALAKVTAVTAAAAAADEVLALTGATGFDRRLPFERFVRETRAGLLHPPVEDVAFARLAAEELDA
ncbi:MAG: hypothetical protein QOE92_2628 [Chloroflexota bacterium]|jgi:alkylation response protein AidB-like acyl-CoA dehydrogenase|nr:hypothetical protein [Chloroflexota bacterium]